uniref:Uncharacterized protein n=1 Tax=Arundo donax TaxID=35708 RepID=A0A0A8YNS2_ARUDO
MSIKTDAKVGPNKFKANLKLKPFAIDSQTTCEISNESFPF